MIAPSAASPSAMPPPILGLVPVTIATRFSSFMARSSGGRRDQERLGGIEDPGVDEAGFLRLAVERAHRAGETRPVQDLLLAAVLDARAGHRTPRRPVAGPECLVHAAVGRRVGP